MDTWISVYIFILIYMYVYKCIDVYLCGYMHFSIRIHTFAHSIFFAFFLHEKLEDLLKKKIHICMYIYICINLNIYFHTLRSQHVFCVFSPWVCERSSRRCIYTHIYMWIHALKYKYSNLDSNTYIQIWIEIHVYKFGLKYIYQIWEDVYIHIYMWIHALKYIYSNLDWNTCIQNWASSTRYIYIQKFEYTYFIEIHIFKIGLFMIHIFKFRWKYMYSKLSI